MFTLANKRNLLFCGAVPLQDHIAGTLEQQLPHLCEPGTVASPNRSAGSNIHYLANVLMGGIFVLEFFPQRMPVFFNSCQMFSILPLLTGLQDVELERGGTFPVHCLRICQTAAIVFSRPSRPKLRVGHYMPESLEAIMLSRTHLKLFGSCRN